MQTVSKKRKITFLERYGDETFEVNEFGVAIVNDDPDMPATDLVLVVDIGWKELPDDVDFDQAFLPALMISAPNKLKRTMFADITKVEDIGKSCVTQLHVDAWYVNR